jgi:quinol monooxygenase YgiN/mannose-6-phosphate isomerase-like protein (cupin superfamily)
MEKISRYMRFQAKPGEGERLAGLLVQVADTLRSVAGCEAYVISREADDGDAVAVFEVWSSAEASEAAQLASTGDDYDGPTPEDVLALVDGRPQRIDLVPAGGVGVEEAPRGWAKRNVAECRDLAQGTPMGEVGQARFPTLELGAERTGVSVQALQPGARQAFGHRHQRAEEVYLVLGGSGRAALDDEVVELAERDLLRVGPEVSRAFEAGDDGLELIAVGARHQGDAEALPGWWGA